jgi:hypothetical protein
MVSPSTGFLLLDTREGAFTVTLPSISSQVGRVITIKDNFYTFDTYAPIISTSGVDRFENGSSIQELVIPGETFMIIGAQDYKWYMLSADRSNQLTGTTMLTLSTLQFFSQRDPQCYGVLWGDSDQRLYWNGFVVRDDDISSLTRAFMSTAIVCTMDASEVSSNVARLSTYEGPAMTQEQLITF